MERNVKRREGFLTKNKQLQTASIVGGFVGGFGSGARQGSLHNT